MAPEPPSPSASSVLLPLIGANRSRRGSLASITSRKEIDKDALQQVLDNIHTSASKSDTLTSFHDFDGGAGAGRAGTKELVSSGMSGLYNRLRQSVGGTPPTKDGKGRPGSSASSYSKRSSSLQSGSPGPSKTGLGKAVTSDSASNAAVPASPLGPSFANNGDRYDAQLAGSRSELLETASISTDPNSLRDTSGVLANSHGSQPTSHRASVDLPLKADVDRARSALRDEDYSESATLALARVLSSHEVHIDDRAKSPPKFRNNEDIDHAIADEDGDERMPPIEPSISRSTFAQSTRAKSIGTLDSSNESHRTERRPPMVRVGVSHLPGFDPSRPGSPAAQEPASSGSSYVGMRAPDLDPSPNINSGLQRRRTGLKPQPAPAPVLSSVPSHFRRRVISKEFWMKDENAKDCFNCGQSFSTFRRKHHCRTCGQIFDARCTSLVPARPFGQPGTLRLCKPCEEIILGSNDDDSSVYSEDGAESLRTPHARRPTPEHVHFSGTIDEVAGSLPSAGEIMTPFIGIPASRRNREAKRRSAVIEFDAGHHTLARPSSSRSLVSLSARPRSSSHKRHQSRQSFLRGRDDRAPFHQEALGEPEAKHALPAFHNDNIIDPDLAPYLSDDGSEYEEPQSIFSAIAPEGPNSSPGDRERLGVGSLLASAMKKGRSKLGDRATVASSVRGVKEDDAAAMTSRHTPRLSRRRNPSLNSINMGRPSPRRSRSNILLKTAETEDFDQRPTTPFVFPRQTGSQLVRSSAMRGSEAPPIELNKASLDHVRKLLQQLLTDSGIEHASSWEKALVPVLLQCTNDVEPDVQRGDDMDIRHYIKLKKIPGGRPGDTSYVSGIVFSKNVALKSMARSIHQPRIAIVTFAIEYARHQSHFMSLEPVIAQEREYLRNLVGRIATLRPHILLVQRNVSGVALRLLEEAGITVAFNIKESVLAAVARVTQTTMIKSVDKLAIDPSHLGQCSSFDVKTYVHQGHRKTYIVLSGCLPDLGCTIVLRGGDTKLLRIIKRITEFMCYVVYNLKLETNLMRDEFVSMPAARPDPTQAHDRSTRTGLKTNGSRDPLFVDPEGEVPSKYGRVEDETRRRILSASPFVIFMQPHMLTQLCDQEQKLALFKRLRDQYAAADVEGDDGEHETTNERFELVRPEMVHAPASKDQPKAVREYLHAVHSAQFERAMASYDSQRKLWESFVATNVDPFDPYSHQSIVVLHSTVSSITSAPCVGPEVLGIGFYAGYNHVEPQFEEDCTLGQYIEDLCLSAGSTCKECTRRMYDHHRQYVHGYGQMSISVQRQPTRVRGLSNTILMWASCRLCHAETTVIPMSDNTWKYSFAKYLELTFWSSPLHPRAGVCEHDIHKDFLRCFGFQDLVVRVQYDPVDIYDIVVPKPIITWKVEADLTVKNEQYSHIVGRLTAFIDSVKKRLTSINVDTLDEKQMIEAQEMIESLRQRAEDDRTELLTKLQVKYGSSRYYEIIPLNRAFRFMDEKALAWDEAFNNFERDYFPSETDIRKLAAAQLKEMFYGAHSTADSVSSETSDNEGATDLPPVPHKSIGQRIADENYSSEKANNVLTTVAQEHRASRDENSHENVSPPDAQAPLGSDLTKTISPREEQEIAAEREEVKHLDLAIAVRSPEDNRIFEDGLESADAADQNEHTTVTEGSSAEPFALQPKPLSSGLLERIEQIRNNRAAGIEDGEIPESRIPRLATKNRGQSPQPTPPPLHRSQTQPAHVPRRSADLKLEGVEIGTSPHVQITEPQPIDRPRVSDRLTHLSNKIGKLPPSLIPRSIPAKADGSLPSSVSALAKHFEQMSREFEKERLRERRQRAAKSRQARANPLGSSQPVVEVYRNATDAVGEKTPEHLSVGNLASPRPLDPVVRVDHAVDQSLTEAEGLALQNQVQSSVDSDVPAAPVEQQPVSDAETDGENSDAEAAPPKTRPRDASDPLSHISSITHISPLSHELELHPEFSIVEHKKNVWFKMLADFWSKRSASGWSNLEYPLHSTEHVFEDSDIIVREDEPSSVVAISLSSSDYMKKLEEFRNNPKINPRTRHRHTTSMASASFTEEADLNNIVEASLLSDTGTHMKYSFAHGSVKASCKIFYAESFDALRRRCGVADRFVESMSRCLKFDSKGGKTKSIFLKTLDNRFIIKSLQEVELKAFTKFAPDYFNFMSHTLFHGVPSVIAKMFGLFQVIIKNPVTGMDFSYYLLVMENLFYEHNPNRRFDLKGSMRNRKIEPTGQSDEVLLDENLVETIFESPLFVREHHRKLLQASVWNDTLWLCKQNVMDYSLMAGFDDDAKQLVVGIIDCIRTYTWDKKLESWIKDRGKNKPTITSPKDYRNRFRVSMMQYVLQAPNCWHQFQAQMAPPKTLREREDYYAADGVEAEEGGNVVRHGRNTSDEEIGIAPEFVVLDFAPLDIATQSGGDVVTDVVATGVPGTVANPLSDTTLATSYGHRGPQAGRRSTTTDDVEAIREKTVSAVALEQHPVPTKEETRLLRKVADCIPTKAYLLCVVEFAERASYYGVKTVFSNFMQFPLPEGGNGAGAPPKGTEATAGALGRGIQFSVAIGLLFTFLAFVIPIPGGWLADAKLSRFKTILLGVLICGVSHIIMIIGAIPSVLQAGNGMAPFMISLILLAIGAGIFKPNVAPAVLDQYGYQKPYVKTLGSGEQVIVDPEVTVQRTMLIFYGLINVGAFFPVATVYCEKLIGFWLAFLLPGIIFFLLPILLWYLNNKLVKYPPDGSALTRVYKIVKTAVAQSKGKVWKKAFLDGAKPSVLQQNGVTLRGNKAVTWTDKDVDDVKRTFVACGIFLYYPIYNLNDNGIGSVQTSQGATMLTKGTPNDLLGHFNALTIVFAVPLLSYVVYPLLRRYNIKFGRVSRITFGFSIAALSGVLGALVQWKIYQLSPCGQYATTCDTVADISIWWQIPNVSLGALSECFCNVTAYELAYARSPPGMKALVTSLFLFTTALSSALGEILTPAIEDPNLVWIWAAPAIVLAVQTVVFWIKYRKYDDDEFMTEETAEYAPSISPTDSAKTTVGNNGEKL